MEHKRMDERTMWVGLQCFVKAPVFLSSVQLRSHFCEEFSDVAEQLQTCSPTLTIFSPENTNRPPVASHTSDLCNLRIG